MTGSETDKCAVHYGKQIKKLYDALKASLELQLHYAKLLNEYDGGKRRLDVFKSPEAWMKRLERVKKNADRKRKKLIHQMLDNQAKLVKKMKAAEKVNRKKVKLIPVDYQRCQTLVPNGNNFMTFGGVPGLVRCENAAVYVATEREPGPEGLKGAMSVCERCRMKLIEIKGADYATFVKIEDKKGRRK
ncbi:hypothetical protein [Candidatus Magnetobacterium casense]|uniref:Uncharacterized protein n=1 Tax=Candidatus Magnetobacterium casense TaxID=1455061 RepID=A0ABS6S3J5_9BACT|nr:hypothetical protein [Candidatus Magnetobacterium casensis]MBV6343422.1 hypothetical protein [Candidatus Magnetobacterium casensis]